ncbi:unnamed protein product [Heterobilharzia americana]|nr:unnamed protein product [Heterobilharzia americana]
MSFSQTYQQTDANYDIPRELETNQLTQTLQAGSEDTNGEKHLLNTNTSSSTSIADINSCSHNNNNSQIIKMNMNMDVQRNNALNPIFNFWRNSTRRSGNWGSRTGTKKSFVWKYFFHPELQTGTKDLAHTQCIICDSLLAFNNSGTTTTMLNHLKSRHSEIVQQEYHQSKKTRCGPLTLREVNKMNKLNYNLLSDEKKFINWSTSTPTITTASTASTIYKRNFPFLSPRRGQRGRPPGACRYSDHSMTGEKFSRNIDENVNSMNKFESSINNKDVSLSQFAAQIEARASNSSFEVMNEKDIKEDQVNPNQRYNESSSVTMDAEAVDKHLSTNEFQLTKPKIGESAVYSPHCLINAYSSSSCFYPSCNEFHHRLAYFLIRDFHPPSILKEEGFKILISTLWDKFRKTNVNVNYNLEFNLLPSSDFMENEILTRLYQEMKFRVDNKIRSLINLQKSSNFSINIPNITIFLKFWSLNQHDNIIFHANNPSFDYVDVELHFFTNYNNVYEKTIFSMVLLS